MTQLDPERCTVEAQGFEFLMLGTVKVKCSEVKCSEGQPQRGGQRQEMQAYQAHNGETGLEAPCCLYHWPGKAGWSHPHVSHGEITWKSQAKLFRAKTPVMNRLI
jgi:hypothetical protein